MSEDERVRDVGSGGREGRDEGVREIIQRSVGRKGVSKKDGKGMREGRG